MQDIDIAGHKVTPVAAGAIIAGSALAVYFAYKRKKSAKSPTGLDPVTGLPYSQDNQVDPLTGQEYLAEAQQYGSVSAAESAVAGESSLAYSNGGTSTGPVGTAQDLQPVTSVGGTTYASNSAWSQAVQAGLADIGYSPTDVSNALGRYLASEPLTAAQASIVQAGIAEYGPPPVGSYKVILAPASTPTGSGSHATLAAPTGVRVSNKTAHEFSLAWNPVHGAEGYHVKVSQLNNKVIADFHVSGPGCTVSANTHPGYSYHVGVQALPGGHGTNITVKLPSK